MLNATIASLDSSVASSTALGASPVLGGLGPGALNISAVPRAASPAPAVGGMSFAIFADDEDDAENAPPPSLRAGARGGQRQPLAESPRPHEQTGAMAVAYDQPGWLGAASPKAGEEVV